MEPKEKLGQLRQQIDQLDRELIRLFNERLVLSDEVADVKVAGNMAINDLSREDEVLDAARAHVQGAYQEEIMSYVRGLLAISKLRQNKRLLPEGELYFPASAGMKTRDVTVVYQGTAGAWGEESALRLFPGAKACHADYFEDVFVKVKAGEADFGVLPIENSQTGAIGEVYDLLRRHGCYIVGQVWIPVAQCLIANKETNLDNIREVLSHPEGFSQCRRFLKNKHWELTACQNTAFAAKEVARRNDLRSAAIASRRAAELYGLAVLAPDIVDDPANKTRFIAIAAQPAYDESSDIISITFSTAHKSGALCAVLQSFMMAGINLSRIESRPAGGEKYRFFADLQASVLDPKVTAALKQAAVNCDYFEILGCYKTSGA